MDTAILSETDYTKIMPSHLYSNATGITTAARNMYIGRKVVIRRSDHILFISTKNEIMCKEWCFKIVLKWIFSRISVETLIQNSRVRQYKTVDVDLFCIYYLAKNINDVDEFSMRQSAQVSVTGECFTAFNACLKLFNSLFNSLSRTDNAFNARGICPFCLFILTAWFVRLFWRAQIFTTYLCILHVRSGYHW